jgi:integrase
MKKQTYENAVDKYIESKALSWSETTCKTERSRLLAVDPKWLDDPKGYYEFLKAAGRKPYTIKTVFIRVGELIQFLIDNNIGNQDLKNTYKRFIRTHSRLFKNAYQKKALDLTWSEALKRIRKIDDEESRMKALQLLGSGMRYTESNTIKNGQIVGKGGKPRAIHLAKGTDNRKYEKHYTTFCYHLKKVGLTPHMLRKLFATKAAEKGAHISDLMSLMGWSSSHTASIYIQAQRDAELASQVHEDFDLEEKKDVRK